MNCNRTDVSRVKSLVSKGGRIPVSIEGGGGIFRRRLEETHIRELATHPPKGMEDTQIMDRG